MSKSIKSDAIDDLAQQLMIRENVNGMALAVINGGKPEHVAAYGWRNLEQNLRLTTDTNLMVSPFLQNRYMPLS
jgi:CubicO group peptidase (beta-lactamase class C family)